MTVASETRIVAGEMIAFVAETPIAARGTDAVDVAAPFASPEARALLRACTGSSMPRRMANDVLTMPISELQKRAAKAREHLSAIDELLPGLVGLDPEARKHSSKFRHGEPEALASVLVAAREKPALFQSLAALDDGDDPKKFEADLLRDRLSRAEILDALASDVEDVTRALSDTTLHLGDLTRPVMLAAYDICKTHAKTDGAIAKAVQPAIDFYAKVGRISAATRRKVKNPAPAR
jgi:hypothetical protein